MFDLTGRKAVVTGASSGIGMAIAKGLGEAGADVASLYLTDPDGARETEDTLHRLGRDSIMVVGDTSNRETVDSFAAEVEAKWGRIDIWVNNAGRLLVREFLEMSGDEWHSTMGTNLHGYFYGCHAAAKRMVSQGHGRIINVTSVTRIQPSSNLTAYVASKGAVHGLTVSLALEMAPKGITVNAIAPGATHTGLNRTLYTPDVIEQYESRIPIGRIATPTDLAGAAVFLASDESSYVTGHEILVDGGLSINGNAGLGDD